MKVTCTYMMPCYIFVVKYIRFGVEKQEKRCLGIG